MYVWLCCIVLSVIILTLRQPILPGSIPSATICDAGDQNAHHISQLGCSSPKLQHCSRLCDQYRPTEPAMWTTSCYGQHAAQCFLGFLRAGEFTIQRAQDFDPSTLLCLEDVSEDSHSDTTMVCIRLKQSKTSPFRDGVDMFMKRTNSDLCPVAHCR